MNFIPHDYQNHAIETIIENPATGLFLEMGLGKTVTTLTAIESLMYDHLTVKKVLVIAPKRVAESTWPDEINKWNHLGIFRYAKILGPAKKRFEALASDADIYIINRENVVWLVEQFGRYGDKKKKTGFKVTKPWPFDMIVIDELSSFKNQSAKRFKMLRKVRPYCDRIVGLTGTPAPNGLIDLWPQVYLLDQGERLGKTVTGYRDRYFEAGSYIKNAYGSLIPTSYLPRKGAEDKIYEKIGDICLSMKSVDWIKMPELIMNEVKVELNSKAKKQYKDLERDYILELIDETVDVGSTAALSLKLQQLSQGALYTEDRDWVHIHDEKLEQLEELIEEANGKPVLVFYWFKHDLERLKERFKNGVTLDGPKEINDWNDGKIELMFVHPASAGHGLNLQTGGNIIIWFSLTWSLELYQQANARLYRQGQKETVIIHHLISKGTIDERIMAAIKNKEKGQDALMDAVKGLIEKYKET